MTSLASSVTRLPTAVTPVWRVLGRNPGPMTGAGTNSYFIGGEQDELPLCLVDPGPVDGVQLGVFLDFIGERGLKYILVTHTHRDHSPGAVALQRETGAVVVGLPAPEVVGHDQSFNPTAEWKPGMEIHCGGDGSGGGSSSSNSGGKDASGGGADAGSSGGGADNNSGGTDASGDRDEDNSSSGYRLRLVHTPGHASNHVCYLLLPDWVLFTGDHILDGSTSVILPPDGDMTAYLASLRELAEMPLRALAPGHGGVIEKPQEAIEGLIAHRLKREGKIVAALEKLGPCTEQELVQAVYDDVNPAMIPWALRMQLAHLVKLQSEGRAAQTDEQWRLA